MEKKNEILLTHLRTIFLLIVNNGTKPLLKYRFFCARQRNYLDTRGNPRQPLARWYSLSPREVWNPHIQFFASTIILKQIEKSLISN